MNSEREERGREKMEEKNDQGAEGENPHSNPGNRCAHRRRRIGGKKEERIKKEKWSRSPAQLPRTLRSPPAIRRDHAVCLFLFFLPPLAHNHFLYNLPVFVFRSDIAPGVLPAARHSPNNNNYYYC